MICCLCGETVEYGEAVIRITQHKFVFNAATGQEATPQVPLEDGTSSKWAHSVCPAKFGAPLALVGADGGRADV